MELGRLQHPYLQLQPARPCYVQGHAVTLIMLDVCSAAEGLYSALAGMHMHDHRYDLTPFVRGGTDNNGSWLLCISGLFAAISWVLYTAPVMVWLTCGM